MADLERWVAEEQISHEHSTSSGGSSRAPPRTACFAFLWQKRKMTNLGALGGSDSLTSRGSGAQPGRRLQLDVEHQITARILSQKQKMADLGVRLGSDGASSSAVCRRQAGRIVASGEGHAGRPQPQPFVSQNSVVGSRRFLGLGIRRVERSPLNGVAWTSDRAARDRAARPVLWKDDTINSLYRGSTYGADHHDEQITAR